MSPRYNESYGDLIRDTTGREEMEHRKVEGVDDKAQVKAKGKCQGVSAKRRRVSDGIRPPERLTLKSMSLRGFRAFQGNTTPAPAFLPLYYY